MNILELTLVNALERMLAGEFGAVEYVRAMLERNKEVAQLNAVICLDEDRLLEAAARRDRQRQAGGSPALLGAPLLLKDNINSADLPTTGCTPALKGHFPPANAPVAQLLLDAGAVIFGKANMHELAFGITNNNPTFGPARNPYNPDLIPGGSSGGTAAAIGAGILPAGLGTDNGLPVGVCLEGPAGSEQDEVGFLPRPGVRAKGDGIEFRSHTTKQ